MPLRRNKVPLEPVVSRLEELLLYETCSHMYLVGFDRAETCFRVLKIDRRVEKPRSLADIIEEDPVSYNKQDLASMLDMINEGNKNMGGLVQVTSACGLVGFVRFLDCYYITLITQKKEVGCIAGNYIYSIKATEVFPIKPRDEPDHNAFRKIWRKLNKKLNQTSAETAEVKYVSLFQFVDVTKDFFFSYTYDLTHSLQHNFIMSESRAFPPPPSQDMFEWNHYQTQELRAITGDLGSVYWVLPIIHGSYRQRRFSIFGRELDLILIGRRSRHYAGTRYLKRGINVHGKVANDCEVEQILQLDGGLHTTFSSYVQMRGSIPTYWYQETSVTMPKPPILINRVDPAYLATQEHFADLFRRYNAPILVLDLVKQYERRPRESLVGRELRQAVEVLNSSMPLAHQIRYCAFDYNKMSKSKVKQTSTRLDRGGAVGKEWAAIESSLGEAAAATDKAEAVSDGAVGRMPAVEPAGRIDLFRELEDVAALTLNETAIFCSSAVYLNRVSLFRQEQIAAATERGYIEQRGVLRTNCIDCLDRTNVGQFTLGMKFLSVSLQALGLHPEGDDALDPSSPLLVGLMDMFAELGDRIALQYGGSEAHKKVSAGGGKGQTGSQSKSGELLTSIKRYYSNAFTDMAKQDAMNVFLGCYIPNDRTVPLWDLDSDYHLHNKSLHPPEPYVNRILFNDMLKDIKTMMKYEMRFAENSRIGLPTQLNDVEILLEKKLSGNLSDVLNMSPTTRSTSRKVLADESLSGIVADAPSAPADSVMKIVEGEDHTEAQGPSRTKFGDGVIEESISSSQSAPRLSTPTQVSQADEDDDESLRPPPLDLADALSRYFIRPAGSRTVDNTTTVIAESADATEPSNVSTTLASSYVPSSAQATTAPGAVNGAPLTETLLKSIARSERRKFVAKAMEARIHDAIEMWWRSALHDHNARKKWMCLPPPAGHVALVPPYFERVHKPEVLSNFDDLLASELLAPLDAISTAKHNQLIGTGDAGEASGGVLGVTSNAGGRGQRSSLMGSGIGPSAAYGPSLVDDTEISNSAAAAASLTHASAVPSSSQQITSAQSLPGSVSDQVHFGFNSFGSGPFAYDYEGHEQYRRTYDDEGGVLQGHNEQITASSANGFQLSKYVREIGLKARTLVGGIGGFLRKEEASGLMGSSMQPSHAYKSKHVGGMGPDWESSGGRRAAEQVSSLYVQYAEMSADHLLLMGPADDAQAVEEDFEEYLSECNIHVDNVRAMEQLSADSYLSGTVSRGIYQGMAQHESAWNAHAFLTSSIVFVENELVQCLDNASSVGASTTSAKWGVGGRDSGSATGNTTAPGFESLSGAPGSTIASSGSFSDLALAQNAGTNVIPAAAPPSPNVETSAFPVDGLSPFHMQSLQSVPSALDLASMSLSPSSSTVPQAFALRSPSPIPPMPSQYPAAVSVAMPVMTTSPVTATLSAPGQAVQGPVAQTLLSMGITSQTKAPSVFAPHPHLGRILGGAFNALHLPKQTRDWIVRGAARANVATGLMKEAQLLAEQYLKQQMGYALHLSSEGLAARLSGLTSERTILDYSLAFDRDSLAAGFEELFFIVSSRVSPMSLSLALGSIPDRGGLSEADYEKLQLQAQVQALAMQDLGLLASTLSPLLEFFRAKRIRRSKEQQQMLLLQSFISRSGSQSNLSASLGEQLPGASSFTSLSSLSSSAARRQDRHASKLRSQQLSGMASVSLDEVVMETHYVDPLGMSAGDSDDDSVPETHSHGWVGSVSAGGEHGSMDKRDAVEFDGMDVDSWLGDTRRITSLNGSGGVGQAGNVYGQTHVKMPTSSTSRMLHGREYPGFKQIDVDLYQRDSNPYLHLNEVGVLCFVRAQRRMLTARKSAMRPPAV